MATEKEALLALVSKTLNIDNKSAEASLYNEDGSLKDGADAWFLGEHSKHIAKIKTDAESESKGAFDNGYKKAQSEVLGKTEKLIKEKYGLKSEKPLIELVDEAIGSKADVNNLPEDVIKKHPVFIQTEKSLVEKVTEVENTWKTKLEEREKEFGYKETLSTVRSNAMKILEEKVKPKFAENPTVKNTHINSWMSHLEGQYKFDVQTTSSGDASIVVLDKKSGKRVENAQGHAIGFDSIVSDTAGMFFEIPKSEGRSSGAGSEGGKGKQGDKKYSFVKPKDDNEYMQKMAEINDDKTLSTAERAEKLMELKAVYRGAN